MFSSHSELSCKSSISGKDIFLISGNFAFQDNTGPFITFNSLSFENPSVTMMKFLAADHMNIRSKF